MEAEGRVGPVLGIDGNKALIRLGKTGEIVTQNEVVDASLRGEVFYATTAVAGVKIQDTLTTTAPFALYNPDGSDVDLVLFAISMGFVSGTYGAGFLALAKYVESATNAAPTGTVCVAQGSTKFGLTTTPKGRALETVTLVAAATLICAIKDLALKTVGTLSDNPPSMIILPVPLVIPPRTAACLGGVSGAAGSSDLAQLGCLWKEVRRIS